MKLSHTTLFAILLTSSFVSAAPAAVISNDASSSMIKRSDVNDVLSITQELKSLNRKRSFVEDEYELSLLSKRSDSLVTDLVSALASSGIASDVWDTLSNDSDLKTEVGTIVKSALKAAVVQGPALIKAVWNSGLIQTVFKDIINDSDLRSVLLRVAKSVFSSAANLVKSYLNTKNSSSTTTTAVSSTTTTAAAKRSVDEYLNKRDLASVVSSIVSEIKSSGIITTLVNKVLADPQQSISLLTSVLKKGVVIVEDVLKYAKSSGLLEEGLEYVAKNGGTYSSEIASFLYKELESGNVTSSEIDDSDSYSSAVLTGTTIATTAAVTADSYATATVTGTAYTTTTNDASVASAAEAALNDLRRKRFY